MNDYNVKICLNMIVKDEENVITRCLDSVKDIIDSMIIADTGSTDNTVIVLNNYLNLKNNDFNGKIFNHTWKNFSYNRNLILSEAVSWINKQRKENEIWYILFIDADDYIVYENLELFKEEIKQLSKPKYIIKMRFADLIYDRPFLIRIDKDDNFKWTWRGAVHEVITGNIIQDDLGYLKHVYLNATMDGARSKDSMKFLNDAIILEKELKNNNWTNTRDVFYLAESYRDYGGIYFTKMAEMIYLKRFEMGGWDEERYVSLVEAGICRMKRNKYDEKMLSYFFKAHNLRPNRLEAPYFILYYYRLNNLYELGYNLGNSCLKNLTSPNEVLFLKVDIHKYKFYDELALCAYWVGDKRLYKVLCDKILSYELLPYDVKERVENNLKEFN